MNPTYNPWPRWSALYLAGDLTWADLLEITGLCPQDLYTALDRRGLMNH